MGKGKSGCGPKSDKSFMSAGKKSSGGKASRAGKMMKSAPMDVPSRYGKKER